LIIPATTCTTPAGQAPQRSPRDVDC
jgi:hypothetical protein